MSAGMKVCGYFLAGILSLALPHVAGGQAGAGPAAEDYADSIRGIRMGMALGDVLERLEPLPYSGKQEKTQMVLLCKLEDGSTLEVTLLEQRVVQLYLWYKTPRSAAALWLPGAVKPGEGVASNDPRIRREFEMQGASSGTRVAWVRRQATEAGYPIEVGFVSTSRAEQAPGISELIEYKFVTVPESARARFEHIVPGRTPEPDATGSGGADPREERGEDHKASIHGIRLGMNAQQVLERMGGRMPDGRRDLAEGVEVSWRITAGVAAPLATADTVEVHFRGEHVWQVMLRYGEWRPTTDLWLLPVAQAPRQGTIDERIAPTTELTAPPAPGPPTGSANVGGGLAPSPYRKLAPTQLTARDPRWRQDYMPTENIDKTRVSWSVSEKTEDGYRVEIRFVSVAKERLGERFVEYVEYKMISVPKEELPKFDLAHKSP